MTKEEMLIGLSQIELYVPFSNIFIQDVKKAAKELEIEILDQCRVSDKVVIMKMRMATAERLFALGAFVHINNTIPPDVQPDIDDLFKDKLS